MVSDLGWWHGRPARAVREHLQHTGETPVSLRLLASFHE